MNITIDDKTWRFAFDRDTTLEIIGYIFKLNRDNYHLLVDDLVELLFIIDINCLLNYGTIVTGLSYYFNGEGRLRSSELYKLFNDNSDKFSIYKNTHNRNIIKISETAYISDDNLSTMTEELTEAVVKNDLKLLFNKRRYSNLFNTDTGIKQVNKGRIKYISLDFLIDKLKMNKPAIVESLSLHNAMIRSINKTF